MAKRALQRAMTLDILEALDLADNGIDGVEWNGSDRLPSCFPVTELATASIAAASLAISELVSVVASRPTVNVDDRLASLWYGASIRPQGWTVPSAWDAVAGDYRTQDGWIKLHTNAPNHKAAALAVLGCSPARDEVETVVAGWTGESLEQAIVDAGECAAKLRQRSEWLAHPQGVAVAGEPLFIWSTGLPSGNSDWRPTAERPLAGIRVLDLTRILAGPIATRHLAAYGAEVLRIDPPDWDEPSVAPEVTLGKRCARLDLKDEADRSVFLSLLAEADVLVHGYRADALERLGLGAEMRQTIRPGLIDVSLDAYGHAGPWSRRRGFDSLVQFSSGIAARGSAWRGVDFPMSLPVQALDHSTGYLMAAAAVRGLVARLRSEAPVTYRLSLARTAELLFAYGAEPTTEPLEPASDVDLASDAEDTDWGPARRIRMPASISGAPARFEHAASRLGSASPRWAS